jgi:uncharacterized protein (TIGR02271 family)
MITREQVSTVIDHAVYDSEGNKIGNAKHVFLDDVTGEPEWVSVKTGLFGTNESFVPIHEASMVDDHIEVPYAKDTVKDAPNVDVDAGGHLSEAEEHRLYQHYGIDWDAAWQRANQPGQDGWASTGDGTTAMGAAGGAAAGAGTMREGRSGAGRGMAGDDALIRSEERMHVGTERLETGRARLRKYVVTEEQEQTIPVRHEEVRVEREPITGADRDTAMSGAEISEAEREVTLHEERPVTRIETVPVERVRLDTAEVTEEETVRGKVRKEQIEVETERDSDH